MRYSLALMTLAAGMAFTTSFAAPDARLFGRSAAEWKMFVEVDGATNVVTAADGRKYAIDVSVEERDGAWRGKIVNREKGVVVLGFELTSAPLAVTPGKSALYLPHVYGRRIRNWPEHGVRQKGSTMWTETANGVFVPFMSKYDAATGSRAVPLPYPSKLATMQWTTLNDGEEGFYLASEDPLAGAKDILIEYDSNEKRLKMGFHFPMFIPAGLSYDVPKVVMKKYAGTWRTAAKAYRAWWDTCRRVVRIPDAVRKDFTGFMMVILKQQNDQVVWPYTDFKSLGDAALAHGFRHVEFHGWGVGGHDKLYPEYDPDPAMGGRDALVKGVKALQARGLHVSVYSNGQLQQQGGTKWYEEKGRSCPIMRRDGTTMSEYWVKFKDHPGTTFDVACPASPAWRGQMLKICRDAQALGFQGFLYDQIGKQWPSLCFDARHGHRPGAFVFAHDRETMLLDVIDAMHKVDPDFVLWSEAFNDTILDSVALYQGLFYGTDDGYNVANRFVEGNACDMFPEMTFYVFPELILTDRNSTPLCTRKRANGAAVTNLRVDFEVRYPADRDYVERGAEPPEGYYGKIVSKPGEPKLMTKENWRTNRDYLKCVSDFRRANGDLLLCGTFKADEGFSVAGGEKVIANRWDGRNGEAGILVWNADDKPAAVKVAFGGNLLSVREPERGEVDAAEPIPPNTLRLYRYRQVAAAPSVTARTGFAAHSMLTRDGRRMVSYLDGTNTVYELVPTNQLPVDLPPVREWKLYGLKATHTDIGLHNPQYIQRHGTVRRIDEAARLIDADTRGDDDPAAYRYVMEGFWFWDNYHMDKGMDAAWRVVTNYVARGRMDVGVTCAGNHTHLFSNTEIDRSALTKKLLADKWGISTRTFLMADNPGMSCSLITPYLRAGIRYGIFMPNHWNPHPSTIWRKNTAIPAATWNPDAMGGGARVEVSYDSPLPMVFRWKAPGSDDSLLMWCSTQYDHGYERLGVKRSRTPVGEVEKRMPSFLSILERKYPYDIWLAGLYGDDEWPTTGFADFAAEWNKKWAWPQFHTLGRLDEPFEHLEKKFGDKIPTLTGEMTSGWLQHAASAPELLADKLNADRMLETAERLGTFAGTIDRGAVDRAWWYLILNDEHSYGTSGYQGRRVFETWMQHRDWIERATAIASNELNKAVAKLVPDVPDVPATPCRDGVTENRWYRVAVTNGVIYSIYDKDLKRELIDAPANRFLYTRDNHKTWETDPVAALGAEMAQRVYLCDDVKRIDIVNTFKHARDLFNTKRYYRFGYMAFPFAVPDGRFAAHLNGMTIRPYEDCHPMTTDAYFAVRDWCAVENGDFGVALMMRDSTLTEFGEIHPDKTCYIGKPPVGKSAIYPYLFTDWLQMHQPDGDSMNFTFRFAITSYATALPVGRARRARRDGQWAKISQLCEDWLDPYAKWMRAHNVPRVTRETVAEPPPGWTGLIEKPRAGHGEKDGQMYLLWGAEMSPAFDHYELYRDGKFLANVTNEVPDGIPYRVARYEDLGLPTHSRHEYRLRKVWKDGRKDELGEPFYGLTRYVLDK